MGAVNLEITALGAQGDGIAVHEGATWIVPGALPGDRVEVRRSSKKGALFHAEQIAVIAAKERVASFCKIARCGGCMLREYGGAVAWKQAEAERVLGGMRVLPIASNGRTGYRHRTRLHRQKGRTGFFAQASHEIVFFDTCKVLLERLDAHVQALTRALSKTEIAGEIECVYSPDDQRFAVEVVLDKRTDEKAAQASLRSIVGGAVAHGVIAGSKRHGEPYVQLVHPVLKDRGARFFLEPGVFSQANLEMNAALVSLVRERVPVGARVLELHAGAGNLTLGYADKAASTIATEWDEQAVLCLRRNVETYGARVTVDHGGDAMMLAKHTGDVLVLDPPRTGAKAVADALATGSQRFSRIIYVSCDLATLQRDVKRLAERYVAIEGAPVDMFFGTPHIEAVVTLEPK